jgi:HPt (histidine-containing phosphotransfer) domain-containing protein
MARRDLTGAVDFAHLEHYAGGDAALVEEVLSIFREQADIWIQLLEPTAPAGAWKDAAHSLKGSALGVGAFDLAKACEAAEREAADEGRRGPLLDGVRDAMSAALADIAAYLHERALQSLRAPSRN